MTNHLGLNRSWAGFVAAVVVAASLGCGHDYKPPTGSSAALRLLAVQPATGLAGATTSIGISGSAFEPGTLLTIDGVVVSTTFLTSSVLRATAPVHEAGSVDVVVTNPDGRTSKLTGGFRYLVAPPPPVLTVTSIDPAAGTTAGGTWALLKGTGFQKGLVVSIDGVAQETFFGSGTIASLYTSPHAPGPVDLVVTNPDAATTRVTNGFTYALPQSLDFNGTWNAYIDDETPAFRFTIQNNALISITCGTSSPITFATPPTVVDGAFSFTGTIGSVSGRILAAKQSSGLVNVPGCASGEWFADKS